MSRVGKKPVELPSGVSVNVSEQSIVVKGAKSSLTIDNSSWVIVSVEGNTVTVKPVDESKEAKAAWGLIRNLIQSKVEGVSKGVQIELEVNGTGYRAAVEGNVLYLNLGYSHPIAYEFPEDIKITCPAATRILVEGADPQRVGQVAAEIRSFRKPEPYKGKGVKYVNEHIVRKEGKKK